jgi:FMN phosphatase YigB (HAD superfamily)
VSELSTVLFDMIDTLVRFDPERLPRVVVAGREVRSTAGRLHVELSRVVPGLSLDALHDAFLWSYREADRLRAATHREVPAPERFALCYERLGLGGRVEPATTLRLLDIHMRALADAAVPVEGRREVLEWLAGRFRAGVVSNFDYAPTIERLLEEAGIRDRFEVVVVSDQVGWRKPSRVIFEAACAALGVGTAECLFVGDRPDIDVAGARGVGMAAAWLNPAGLPLPEGLPAPDFDLRSLREVREALEGARKIT